MICGAKKHAEGERRERNVSDSSAAIGARWNTLERESRQAETNHNILKESTCLVSSLVFMHDQITYSLWYHWELQSIQGARPTGNTVEISIEISCVAVLDR